MAWRRHVEAAHIEAPEWYRNFHPEDWDEPDGQERHMMAGNLGWPWPEELHRIHSERRWGEAKYRYRQTHPALAEQEFAELIESARRPV
jgi:hypothetical protein